jgi:hypothetical protein
MAPLLISLRVVCYRDGERWFAHCLEFDLIGDGLSPAEAVAQLAVAIRLQIEFSIEHDNIQNLFSPADGDLFLRFAAGKKSRIANRALLMRLESIAIRTAEIHVFEEALAAA